MARERGSGITPVRVVEELKKAVTDKSQLEVSKQTGLGQAAINRYLKGIGEPTTATLEKLAALTGVSIAELRGEKSYDTSIAGDCLEIIVNAATEIMNKSKKRPVMEELSQTIINAAAKLSENIAASLAISLAVEEQTFKDEIELLTMQKCMLENKLENQRLPENEKMLCEVQRQLSERHMRYDIWRLKQNRK